MVRLNFPDYTFRFRTVSGKKQIFDTQRKKFVSLTPEEWVRQNFLMYLTQDKNYPSTLVSVETGMKLYKKLKRTDILIFDRKGNPVAIVECKAPNVQIDKSVFDQIVRYNIHFNVKFLMVTNGLQHFCCQLDYQNNSYAFLPEIPDYNYILT
ncbi:MAG: type I restriction enzyme HsdR N-terminal domain-containing protein [Bacteroidales bacterium]|nr:type I restriction enzyme HsdR N-terminal domain-containing protein [Bacteroidales bacterium]